MGYDVINRQAFEITCSSEELATVAQRELEHHTLIKMNGIIGSILSELIEPGIHLAIEKIEIDLGELTVEELSKNEVFEKFSIDFKKQILSHKTKKTEARMPPHRFARAPENEAELLRILIAEGDMPWWIDKTQTVDVNRRLQALLKTHPVDANHLLDAAKRDLRSFWRMVDFMSEATKGMIGDLRPGYFESAEAALFLQGLGSFEAGTIDQAGYLERFRVFLGQRSQSSESIRRYIFNKMSLAFLSVVESAKNQEGQFVHPGHKKLRKKFRDALKDNLEKLSIPQLEFVLFQLAYFENPLTPEQLFNWEELFSLVAKAPGPSTVTGGPAAQQSAASTEREKETPSKDQSSLSQAHTEHRKSNNAGTNEPMTSPSPGDLLVQRLLTAIGDRGTPVTTKRSQKAQASGQALVDVSEELILLRAWQQSVSNDRLTLDVAWRITGETRPVDSKTELHPPSNSIQGDGLEIKEETARNANDPSLDGGPTLPGADESSPLSEKWPDGMQALEPEKDRQIALIEKLLPAPENWISDYLKHFEIGLVSGVLDTLKSRKQASAREKQAIKRWTEMPEASIFQLFTLFLALSAEQARLALPKGKTSRAIGEKQNGPQSETTQRTPDKEEPQRSQGEKSNQKSRQPQDAKIRSGQRTISQSLSESIFQQITKGFKRADFLTLEEIFQKKKIETAGEKVLFKKMMSNSRQENEFVIQFLAGLPESEIMLGVSRNEEQQPIAVPSIQPMALRDSEGEVSKKIYIENAGLCLIAVYLTGIFKRLDYVEKSMFKSKASASRALFLSQYLVTGKRKSPEYVLQLNKVLCGFRLEDSIVTGIRLTPAELAEADQLLNSVIEHWKALKNTSIDGFRDSFLQRKGILQEDELKWTLRVERKGYDLLLNTIPWGYSLIKLPWMKKHLTVEW